MGGLSSEQSKLYRKTVDETLDAYRTGAPGPEAMQVLALLTSSSRSVTTPPRPQGRGHRAKGFSAASAKLQRLGRNRFDEVSKAGDRALLSRQFARMGHLLKAHLEIALPQEVPPFLYGSNQQWWSA